MGSYSTYLSLANLQPRFLSLQWKICPSAEHSEEEEEEEEEEKEEKEEKEEEEEEEEEENIKVYRWL